MPSRTTGPARKCVSASTYEYDMRTELMVGETVRAALAHMRARHLMVVPTVLEKVTQRSVVGVVVHATEATQVAPPSLEASQVVVVPVADVVGEGVTRIAVMVVSPPDTDEL